MEPTRDCGSPARRTSRRRVTRMLLSGCVAGSLSLGALAALASGPAAAAPPPLVLHFFQKQTSLTFFNASNVVIQGYPPVGGHVREDDVDSVGSHSHHGKQWSVSDHLYCTVVSAPANADCSFVFAIAGSLLYSDNASVNLAADVGTIPVTGGSARFAGYTGTTASTSIGNSNNSDLVITLHKS
jgi:hypothetical protein